MALEEIATRTARVALENGTDSEGNMKYVNQSITGISKSGWDADKFLNIVGALGPCLSKTIGNAQTVVTSNIRAN